MADQFGRSHAKHFGQPHDLPDRRAAQPAFQQADEGAVETSLKARLLLGEAVLFSEELEGPAKGSFGSRDRLNLCGEGVTSIMRKLLTKEQATERTLSVREAAQLAGISINYCYRLVWDGRLPAVPAARGRCYRIPVSAVEGYKAERLARARRILGEVNHG